ncbi:Trimethylamine-N-oxide reductase (cytochrome c) [Syntrophobotulus glycolicus DSM 8271]|uniref:Trimethylamine-N-oxide reductase (Cytochrome c) n=1 Tax=Syntrophobotulus glycolicus (strain DSM 8271 / FlGlyR) TaxID=645991 RepID=F0T2U8_SYNGF|nr:molybdopterin-dependent oxidoreductase [Syntrophobotulus glycolicus]ADY57585.1 Trimethylamine-N-oxide reductase (cytochrome c) [Syntrophobotulus glycolicus DSM 8271]
MKTVRSACPLNCPDGCGFMVDAGENGIKVRADVESMGRNSFICPKGRSLGEMVFAPQRLRTPVLRRKKGWQRISWDDAYDFFVKRIQETLDLAGSQGILHLYDHGHNGLLRNLDRRFFQALGGVTEPSGSMCWGAGLRAQEKDFGAVLSSDPEDILNSRTIILWGRDPAVTNKHLVPLLREAAEKKIKIILINPNKVKSAAFADEYIRVNPGTDGILALGIAHIILEKRWMDLEFASQYVKNFGPYAALVKEFPPARSAEISGVPVEEMEKLAERIIHHGPVMFYLGYGLQRYVNGCQTVRAIDALAAISGNIGKPGAGVYYGHQYHQGKLNSVLLPEDSYRGRTIPHALIAEELLKEEQERPIQMAVVTRTNPLVTEPDSLRWRELWQNIPFKVTLDIRMSETARQSDLVLPVTTIFEEEDLLAGSWSNKIRYCQQAIEPQYMTKPEPVIFTELAQQLGIGSYFEKSPREWLEYILEPLKEQGITLEKLKDGAIKPSYIPNVAWEDKDFLTPSGKIELISFREFIENIEHCKIEQYFSLRNSGMILDQEAGLEVREQEYPYILMTSHPETALHTQFQTEEGFKAFIHPELAAGQNLSSGEKGIVRTDKGQLTAEVLVTDDIHPRVVLIPEGSTGEDGLGVNSLISGKLSQGDNTSYDEVFCQIRKLGNNV